MCGRTSLFVPQSVLEERFNAQAVDPIVPRYNIAPEDNLATIPNDDPDAINQYEWGFTPVWDEKKHLINARSESVHEKQTFKESFEQRRCLILADGFYEWEGQRGTKQPYRIERIDDEPFAFAGLWQEYENGDRHRQVTILTTDSNTVMDKIHDRMPVMLEPDDESVWLESDDVDEVRSLLDPFPDKLTDAYPISKAVNNPGNDSPEVIDPIDIGDQAGLGEFSEG